MAQLTKDADLLICELYAEYLRRRKDGAAKSSAREFPPSESLQRDLLPAWSTVDISETLVELKRAGFIKMYITGDSALNDEAIIYMENRFKNGLLDVLDVISKLKP